MLSFAHKSFLQLLIIPIISSLTTGCIVSVRDDEPTRPVFEERAREETLVEDDRVDREREIIEEETTTTTTVEETTDPTTPESQPVEQFDLLFFEDFESPTFAGLDHLYVTELNPWDIDWTPGSICEEFLDLPNIELQRNGLDVSDEGEAEGEQHLRLEGSCGDLHGVAQISTFLSSDRPIKEMLIYARAAEDSEEAVLEVDFGGQLVMSEALTPFWSEYVINLEQAGDLFEGTLAMVALSPGVIIDNIQVID